MSKIVYKYDNGVKFVDEGDGSIEYIYNKKRFTIEGDAVGGEAWIDNDWYEYRQDDTTFTLVDSNGKVCYTTDVTDEDGFAEFAKTLLS
jgi:hypothetical protein